MSKSVYTVQYQQLQKLLVDARRAAEISQADLATQLARPQSFVSKYERGERRLDVVEFLQVCDALGVDPHELLDDIHGARSQRRVQR